LLARWRELLERLGPVKVAVIGALVVAVLVGAVVTGVVVGGGGTAAAERPASTVNASRSGPSAVGGSSAASGAATSAGATAAPLPPGLSAVVAPPGVTASPVSIKSVASFGGNITARVTKFSFGTNTDQGPGVLSGVPEVTFTIALTNGSKTAISGDHVEVTAAYGSALTPGAPANLGLTTPIAGSLSAGATATGTYGFSIPANQQANVTLSIWIDSNRPTVVLTGATR
jgi:hypothetical protein